MTNNGISATLMNKAPLQHQIASSRRLIFAGFKALVLSPDNSGYWRTAKNAVCTFFLQVISI